MLGFTLPILIFHLLVKIEKKDGQKTGNVPHFTPERDYFVISI
jgi:hypothetical protein